MLLVVLQSPGQELDFQRRDRERERERERVVTLIAWNGELILEAKIRLHCSSSDCHMNERESGAREDGRDQVAVAGGETRTMDDGEEDLKITTMTTCS